METQKYHSMYEAYRAVYHRNYQTEASNPGDYEAGARMGRAAGDHMDAHGKAGEMQGVVNKRPAGHSKNQEMAKKAKDPAKKQAEANKKGRRGLKGDLDAQVKMIQKDPQKEAKKAAERRAKLKKKFGGPGINLSLIHI